ncbi:MAG: M23 family metallopeptidase [Oscillospiraceae bacterium]|nr:M23 family metallopeptidase [Oscillospiraceae bacterium]
MAEEDKNVLQEAAEKSSNAAHMISGAIKTGKTVAATSKGAAVGGPYGAVAAGLWQNRKTVGKIIAAVAFILFLPILFILMLPSIIFGSLFGGGGGSDISDVPDINIMNDNAAIVQNISEIETAVNTILRESHDKVLDDINAEISGLSADTETEITDSYADDIFFNSDLIISQYCASKGSYEDINIDNLKATIEFEKDNLFSYTTKTDTIIEKDENDNDVNITKITYTVIYSGDDYFADNVFRLTDEQKTTALDYATNLSIFLDDDFNNQASAVHNSLSDLADTYPYEWSDSQFNSPFAGMDWQAHITSGFGSRTDPITGAQDFHTGIDIAFTKGTPVHAAKSGVVVVSEMKTTGYGFRIVINHGNGYYTLYGHCRELLVNVGDTVNAGDVIAKVGTTGRSTGNHLHFELIKDGIAQNPMNFINS